MFGTNSVDSFSNSIRSTSPHSSKVMLHQAEIPSATAMVKAI